MNELINYIKENANWIKDLNLIVKLKEPSVQLAFVTAQRQYAKTGDKITFTATPDSGYTFKNWEIVSGHLYYNHQKIFYTKL